MHYLRFTPIPIYGFLHSFFGHSPSVYVHTGPLMVDAVAAEFGTSVAMTGSGKVLAIGASHYGEQAGAGEH